MAIKPDVRAIHVVLAAIKRDSGARGTPSVRGGSGKGPPAPQRKCCLLRRQEDIDTTSATSPRQQTYTITAPPGERQAQGEGGRGGYAATRLTPTANVQAIDAVLRKEKRLTWQWRWAGKDITAMVDDPWH